MDLNFIKLNHNKEEEEVMMWLVQGQADGLV